MNNIIDNQKDGQRGGFKKGKRTGGLEREILCMLPRLPGPRVVQHIRVDQGSRMEECMKPAGFYERRRSH